MTFFYRNGREWEPALRRLVGGVAGRQESQFSTLTHTRLLLLSPPHGFWLRQASAVTQEKSLKLLVNLSYVSEEASQEMVKVSDSTNGQMG